MAKIVSCGVSKRRSYFDCNADRALHLFLSSRPGAFENGPQCILVSRTVRVLGLAALLCAIGTPGLSPAQTNNTPPPSNAGPADTQGRQGPLGKQEDSMARSMEASMAERRNSERQKMLVADTDKLLLLAQQLKSDVDKTNKDMLSIDVVRRAEQIEKLARSVKDKMRGN